mmetsp:Transcript_7188/g.10030  ORF Transcript_7188/g.10030 Transcript_7188/m.10030 type:complete len:204 (-) Transcript_7188:98-709(-)
MMNNSDWLSPVLMPAIITGCFNLFSSVVFTYAFCRVKKWIKSDFDDLRRWRWSTDGLFAIYMLLFTVIFAVDIYGAVLIARIDADYFASMIVGSYAYSSVSYFLAITLYTWINFFAVIYALHMYNKMSRSVWSKKLAEEENDGKTSQMDRMVAAGWFDHMLLDRNFKFKSYTRHVPRESLASNRSSEIAESTLSESLWDSVSS